MWFASRDDAAFSALLPDEEKARAWVADYLKRYPFHRFVIGPVTDSAGVTVSPAAWRKE
jgi:hypothetical protein